MNKLLQILIVVLFLLLSLNIAGAKQMQNNYHGTLNLVIGDSDCLIVATDSRATITNGNGELIGREDNHQKLFSISDDIVVTIAGYNRVSVIEAPEFTAPAASLILDYIDQLKTAQRTPSYDEAINSLIHILTFNLTSIANINAWSEGNVNINNYIFQMIIVGKKNDKLLMTKVILSIEKRGDDKNGYYINSVVSDIKTDVANSFKYLTAGYDAVALKLLKKMSQGEKTSLSREKLESTIKFIMNETNKANEGVGGPLQLAIFTKGKLEVLSTNFERPVGPSIKYNLLANGHFVNANIAVSAGVPFLHITCTFKNAGIILDNNYFYGCNLDNCNIYLTNNAFSFHQSNQLTNCRLYIGKRVNLKSKEVKRLMSRFAKKSVYLEKSKT